MGTEIREKKKVRVKEKFGDYLMDISKYVFTAVIIRQFSEKWSQNRGYYILWELSVRWLLC